MHLVAGQSIEADGPRLAGVQGAGQVPHPKRAVVRSGGEEAGGGAAAERRDGDACAAVRREKLLAARPLRRVDGRWRWRRVGCPHGC